MVKTQMNVALSDVAKLLNDIPGHIYWKDKRGRYLGCNLKQAHSYGSRDVDGVINKDDFAFYDYQVALNIRNNDLLVMGCGKPLVIEETAVLNGRKRIFLSHKAPIKNAEGHSIGILGVSLDITHQKELEEQLVKSNRLLKKLLDRQKILEAELTFKQLSI